MITTLNLTKSYDGSTSLSFPDVEMSEGEQAVLVGESGTGKTTFLHNFTLKSILLMFPVIQPGPSIELQR